MSIYIKTAMTRFFPSVMQKQLDWYNEKYHDVTMVEDRIVSSSARVVLYLAQALDS